MESRYFLDGKELAVTEGMIFSDYINNRRIAILRCNVIEDDFEKVTLINECLQERIVCYVNKSAVENRPYPNTDKLERVMCYYLTKEKEQLKV